MRHGLKMRGQPRRGNGTSRRELLRAACLGWCVLGGSLAMEAQTAPGQPVPAQRATGRSARRWTELVPGGEVERYLRLVGLRDTTEQATGMWTLRAFGPSQLAQLLPLAEMEHPWQGKIAPSPASGWWVVRPTVSLVGNSGFPWGIADGPVWAGRGLTGVVNGGVAGHWRGLSIQLAPIGWWTQNRPYAVLPPLRSGSTGVRDFAATGIDLPQRFGNAATGRIDPGESSVSLTARGVTAGVTTAAEWWGPSQYGGNILGNQGGGFPRGFLGTAHPIPVGVGRVQLRTVAGRLPRSAYTPTPEVVIPYRLALGAVGTFSPRGLPGLELGATRFFHREWPPGGMRITSLRPLWEPFLKRGIAAKDTITSPIGAPDNQLASAFARLRLPRRGAELYAEVGREDHAWSLLDLLLEPDYLSFVAVGWQIIVRRAGTSWWVVRSDLVNGRPTHLARIRSPTLFYEHGQLQDGHTVRGQLLGNPMVRGGSGAALGLHRYDPRGRLSVEWSRTGLAIGSEGGVGYGVVQQLQVGGVHLKGARDVSWQVGVGARVPSVAGASPLVNLQAALGWTGPW